jgi:hypothetical protein
MTAWGCNCVVGGYTLERLEHSFPIHNARLTIDSVGGHRGLQLQTNLHTDILV